MADVAIPKSFRSVRGIATPVCALARNDIALIVSVMVIRNGVWNGAFLSSPNHPAADP